MIRTMGCATGLALAWLGKAYTLRVQRIPTYRAIRFSVLLGMVIIVLIPQVSGNNSYRE